MIQAESGDTTFGEVLRHGIMGNAVIQAESGEVVVIKKYAYYAVKRIAQNAFGIYNERYGD